MTRIRFLSALMALACVAVVVGAAPVPKDAGKSDPTPDLKAFFALVKKTVESEKWPAEADEKLLRDTARVIFERTMKAAEQKDRKPPVGFEELTRLDVVTDYKGENLDGHFLIAKDVQVTTAKNSVIFANGNVKITSATNCVIVAPNVRCTVVDECVIVAGEYIRLTGARRGDGKDGSVLVAGQWIRTTSMDGTICHVARPGTVPAPDEGKLAGRLPQPAVRTNGARNVIFLNAVEDTGANRPVNCTYLPLKTPLAK